MDIHIIIPDNMTLLDGCLFAAGELKRRAKRQGCPLDAPQHADSPHRFIVRLLALDWKNRRVSYRIETLEAGAA